jgi:hypothetical protein
VLPPALIGLAVLVALVALLPARRLQLAGLAPWLIAGYVAVIWLGGMVVGMAPGTSRWLFPILLIAWLGPFVVAPDRLNRVLRRGGPGSGMVKDVTPPAGPGGPDGP